VTDAPRPGPDTKPGDESPQPVLGLFEGYGVEIEYVIVDAERLDVRPVADRLMEAVAGEPTSEVELNGIAWSNELALHVLEMKTNGPARKLEGLAEAFQASVAQAHELLVPMGCRLLPGGAHPWMDPERESRLWPHEYTEIYRTFDRIFSCRGHGWSNLQATHLNLPFQGDRELALLHAAVRVVLPLLPALAASSPFLEGRPAGPLDARMAAYRENSSRVPSVAGRVVPEPAVSRAQYQERILEPLYRDLAPLDPGGVLRHEWVNARGAIARFRRGTVEIRILDAQECPEADLGVVAAVTWVIRRLVNHLMDRADGDPSPLNRLPTSDLADLLDAVIQNGERAPVATPGYLRALGLGSLEGRAGAYPTAGHVWKALLADGLAGPDAPLAPWRGPLEVILHEGPLARRLLAAAGPRPSRSRLWSVYRELARCLAKGTPFPGVFAPVVRTSRDPLPRRADAPRSDTPRPVRPLVTCEHGGNLVPQRWTHLFPGAGKELESHRGWDPGALGLARHLAGTLPAPFRYTLTTRLLVDVNRSPGNPELLSNFSGSVSEQERRRLIRRYHRRHWTKVRRLVERMVGEGALVLHVGVHTFTPMLHGQKRTVDLGVLFDPAREMEAAFAELWVQELRRHFPALEVRKNEPYHGADDGLTTHLRALFAPEHYLGIELEVKQGPLVGDGPEGERARKGIIASCQAAMGILRRESS
jgi:glutamate---cysteine ligase / carboxylate-amine ligase